MSAKNSKTVEQSGSSTPAVTSDDIRKALESLARKTVESKTAHLHALLTLNHLLRLPNAQRLFSDDLWQQARDLWLKVKTADGRVRLGGSADDAAVSTVSGSIVIEDGRYARGRFESVTGGVEFRGSIPRGGTYSFETHSGPVTLRLAPAPDATVSVTTFGGEVRSDFGPAPESGRAIRLGSGEASVTIRTFRGPVALRRR